MIGYTQKFHRHLPVKKRPLLREIQWFALAESDCCWSNWIANICVESVVAEKKPSVPTPTDSSEPKPLDLSKSTGLVWTVPFPLLPLIPKRGELEEKPPKPTTPITIFKCGVCTKQYLSNSQYRAHIRRHESKQSGRYKCVTCMKNFVQRSSLKTHERIHTGERPYTCTECSESFGDFSTFTKHRRTHTGEKPYACPVCERRFSQSGNMHRHLKVVHKHRPDL